MLHTTAQRLTNAFDFDEIAKYIRAKNMRRIIQMQRPYCGMNNDIQHIRYAEKDALLYFLNYCRKWKYSVRRCDEHFVLTLCRLAAQNKNWKSIHFINRNRCFAEHSINLKLVNKYFTFGSVMRIMYTYEIWRGIVCMLNTSLFACFRLT